jgi:hypothetical protein
MLLLSVLAIVTMDLLQHPKVNCLHLNLLDSLVYLMNEDQVGWYCLTRGWTIALCRSTSLIHTVVSLSDESVPPSLLYSQSLQN